MTLRSMTGLVLAAVAASMAVRPGVCPAAESGEKIQLRVFYVGHPGSDREKDFVGLLEKHFAKVGTGDLAAFAPDKARDWDVVILDYDGDGAKAPRPKLPADYARPTLTIGIMGARLGSDLKLRTSYG